MKGTNVFEILSEDLIDYYWIDRLHNQVKLRRKAFRNNFWNIWISQIMQLVIPTPTATDMNT